MDITNRLFEVARQASPYISINDIKDYESAVELMNPGIDSGMILMNTAIPESCESFDHRQIASIIDKLLFNFSKWIHGESTVYTIFSCKLFLLHPKRIDDIALSLALKCFHRLVTVFHERLRKVSCISEEDYAFSALSYTGWRANTSFILNGLTNIQSSVLEVRLRIMEYLLVILEDIPVDYSYQSVTEDLDSLEQNFMEEVPDIFDWRCTLIKTSLIFPHKVREYNTEECFAKLKLFFAGIEHLKFLRRIRDLDVASDNLACLPSMDIINRVLVEDLVIRKLDANILEKRFLVLKLLNKPRRQRVFGNTVHRLKNKKNEGMIEYIHLGFDIDLYTIDDIGMVMFYLENLYALTSNEELQILSKSYVFFHALLIVKGTLKESVCEKNRFSHRFSKLPIDLDYESYFSFRLIDPEELEENSYSWLCKAENILNSNEKYKEIARNNIEIFQKAQESNWKSRVNIVYLFSFPAFTIEF